MFTNRNFDNVIPYKRWSTLEQGHSDRSSLERQTAITHGFCAEMGWTVTHPDEIDAGKSAFTGANLTKGRLGKLTTNLLCGAIEPRETVIVVEALDRLSRQSPTTMFGWIVPLLTAGVTFAVVNTRQIITEASFANDAGNFMMTMMSAFGSHQFGATQRSRGNGSWNKRRDAAREGRNISRHRTRGWLEWNPMTKTYGEIPARVWLVREAFRLNVHELIGKGLIARLFNEKAAAGDARYAAFSSSKKQPAFWTATAIGRLLHDPAVTGLLQYHNNPRGADRKVPVGDPVKVYPEIISQELFARANEGRQVEQLRYAQKGKAVSNMFGPLAQCAQCGGTMQPLGSSTWRTNKDGSKSQHYFLYCQTAKLTKGAKCENQRGWTYSKIEQPIMDNLLRLAIDDQHFRADDTEAAQAQGEVIRLRRQMDDQTKRARVMLATIGEDAMDYEIDAYESAKRNIRVTKEALDAASETLAAVSGQVSPAEHIVRVSELRDRMFSDDPDQRYQARLLAKSALKGLIDSMTFYHGPDPWGGAPGLVWVELIHGVGNLFIRPDGSVDYVESGDTRTNSSKVALASAQKNRGTDEAERVEAFVRRRSA